ncbi:hypothetical protein [Neisseria sicca]|uniref:hypothetical protein n=1 Tax=Neisseria sicca TaxID=490 RepID=UPI0011BCF6DA
MKVGGYRGFEGVEEEEDKEWVKIAGILEVLGEVVMGDLCGEEVEKVSGSVGDGEVEERVEIVGKERRGLKDVK